MWSETGEGTQFERRLVERCIENLADHSEVFCNELWVHATPIMRFGKAWGAIVYGWSFGTFASGMGCERIARKLGLSGVRMWAAARLERPVAPARMETYTELLKTMIAFTATQAEAIERLNALGRMREVFLASVSHEMRTPLSAISLRLELLLHGTLDDPVNVRDMLTSMQENVRQEERLIEDLIDASKTRTGQLQIFPWKADLQAILRQAAFTVEPQARLKQVAVSLHELHDGELPLWGDALRLQQLFWNLISNAVKFTPAAGTVDIHVRTGEQFHEIDVQDTGAGIASDVLPHIFDAFVKRGEGNQSGLGLGLSIARHIAELHGGSIVVAKTQLMQGTTFTVYLPAVIPEGV